MDSDRRHIYILHGPTGAGKSDFACSLAPRIRAEIINADCGQLYAPLSIGTAKPAWQQEHTPHHLFDVLDEPRDCTVIEYRDLLVPLVTSILEKAHNVIIVGGSSFYIQSILFPPCALQIHKEEDQVNIKMSDNNLWQKLYAIDPARAAKIHPNDAYRLKRALYMWQKTQIQPSLCAPQFCLPYDINTIKAPVSITVVHVTRDRTDLHERINNRTRQMLKAGWLDECNTLLGTPWENFLYRKKLIGYPHIMTYLKTGQDDIGTVVEVIQQKTRAYAKRQETFWRKLKRSYAVVAEVAVEEINLTLQDYAPHIERLLSRVLY